MKHFLLFSCALLLLSLPLSATQMIHAAGNTYYVAPEGNDAYPGTFSQPWRTIQKAASTAQAGDTVYIRGGVYHEKVIVRHSGAPGVPITFQSYPGETAVIDVSGIPMANYHEGGFTISEKDHIRVIGLRVINSTSTGNGGFGIVCYRARFVTIRDNSTYNTYRSGIIVRSCSNVVVDGNEIEAANNGGNQEMLAISGSTSVTVTNNHVHHGGPTSSGGEGISVYNASRNVLVKGNHVHHAPRAGIYINAYQGNLNAVVVEGNRVHDNQRSGIAIEAEIGGYTASNVIVTNNLVYRNGTSGILLGNWGNGTLQNIWIVNNTVVENGIGAGGGGIALWNTRARKVIVRNNLLSQNVQFTIHLNGTPATETTITHNLIDDFRNLNGETRGTNYVIGEPYFVNPSQGDFCLLPDSPAINAGTLLNAPGYDFHNTARDQIDIGACEYSDPPRKVIFSDTFEVAFSGWMRSGNLTWYTGSPRLGIRSVRLTGNAQISKTISTQGYQEVILTLYLGAASYENNEELQVAWWDGSAWRVLTAIKNGSPRENNRLNRLQFRLPAAAANRPDFKLRIRQANADSSDYGYVDSIQLSGLPIP